MRIHWLLPLMAMATVPAAAQKGPASGPQPGMVQLPVAIRPAVRAATPSTAQRTIEILRSSGILSPSDLDRPFTLSARAPFLDAQTYITVDHGSLRPDRNEIRMEGARSDYPQSMVTLFWNADPDRRYVVDCAFASSRNRISFTWGLASLDPYGPITSDTVPVVGGRAAIVLPVGHGPSLQMRSEQSDELLGCDVTAFSG